MSFSGVERSGEGVEEILKIAASKRTIFDYTNSNLEEHITHRSLVFFHLKYIHKRQTKKEKEKRSFLHGLER